ncbi:MAG: hypothetical protein HLUCCO07_07290 [Rhodobacteraceae bacterium HLUCCO07]|nr:MAG: hypothetical protein HLUCCO07_07290 [Rhodobacteraceae bacterium HLUCCO07]
MNFDVESLQKQIPYYLTAEDRQVLVNDLKAITRGGTADFFLSPYRDMFKKVMLQGDGWRGFQLFLFNTGDRRSVQGMVVSNSCDIDPDNQRDLPARVIFAPLVKLAAFEAVLRKSGIEPQQVDEKLAAIRAQKTTNMFFLPSGGPLAEDHVVRLDDVHSMPVVAHFAAEDREKLFTLSNTGFYMLILKLTVHFCRLQERVNRKNTAITT